MGISGTLWQLLDDRSLGAIADAAMRLLTRTGVRVDHEGMLDRLEAAGCRVDRGASRCHFAERLVHDAVGALGSRPAQTVRLPGHWRSTARLSQVGSFPHLLEWPAGRRRLATADDVRDMAKMAHVLDDFERLGQVLTCSDVAPPVEPIWNAVTRMETTDKPLDSGEVLCPETIPYLCELGRIWSGGRQDNRLVAACDFAVAPLHYGRRTVECMIEKSRHGIEHQPGTMPISGLSAPVTLAGTVTVAVAELLAGWAMYYLLDPALSASGIVASGILDMRTAHACFGSPEAVLQDVATVEVCRRRFGMAVGMAANYVDAKTPGMQAVYEKLLPLAAMPVGGLAHLFPDGLLSAGQDYCPVQHVLELQLFRGVYRFYEGFSAEPAMIAEDLIDRIARGEGATFLDTDHTAEFHLREQWHPRWLDRSPWQGDPIEAEREGEMLREIDAYCRKAVQKYTPPALDPDKLSAARELLRRAEVELQGVAQRA